MKYVERMRREGGGKPGIHKHSGEEVLRGKERRWSGLPRLLLAPKISVVS